MRIFKHKKSFTLVELLITVAIIALMAALAIPAFNQYGANNEVSVKTEEIEALLQNAYSLSQSPPPGVSSIYFFISDSSQKIWTSTSSVITDTASEIDSVTIPNYMHFIDSDPLNDPGDVIICEFSSSNEFDCTNDSSATIPKRQIPLMIRTITSDKTTASYQIIMEFENFKVSFQKIP